MDNNFNIDNNTMNKIKNLVDNGNISDALSQISPEMIQNFSKLMNNQNSNNTSQNSNSSSSNTNTENQNIPNQNINNNSNMNNNSNDSNFNLNNIDMNTIMKLSSAFGNMNKKNDPRANLLNSLKPYLRDQKKDKLDNYINLLNMGKIADVLKNTNLNTNENNNNKENNNHA